MIPPEFTSEVVGGKQLALSSSYERAALHGEALTHDEVHVALSLLIDRELQPFDFQFNISNQCFDFFFKRELSSDEKSVVEIACSELALMYPPEFFIDGSVGDAAPKKVRELMAPSKRLKSHSSNRIVSLYEKDEDYWVDNRVQILSDVDISRSSVLPNNFVSQTTSCFLDASVFSRGNIREYLTLYERIIIAPPLSAAAKDLYEDLCINRREMRELVARGRIQFALPASLDWYSPRMLENLAEVNPEALLFSRRLAAASVVELRARTGILGYSFDAEEKREILNAMISSDNEVIKLLGCSLPSSWSCFERMINLRGAKGVAHAGLSSFISDIYRRRGKDVSIELHAAALPFEWSLGLGAHHIPFSAQDYSEVNAVRTLGQFYGGFDATASKLVEADISEIISQLLVINNDMPVLELDDILTSSDIKRLPELLATFAGLDNDGFNEALYEFNRDIRRLEKNRERLAGMKVDGLLALGVGAASSDFVIGLLTWVVGALGNHLLQSKLSSLHIVDRLVALNHRVDKNVVMVSRIRKSV